MSDSKLPLIWKHVGGDLILVKKAVKSFFASIYLELIELLENLDNETVFEMNKKLSHFIDSLHFRILKLYCFLKWTRLNFSEKENLISKTIVFEKNAKITTDSILNLSQNLATIKVVKMWDIITASNVLYRRTYPYLDINSVTKNFTEKPLFEKKNFDQTKNFLNNKICDLLSKKDFAKKLNIKLLKIDKGMGYFQMPFFPKIKLSISMNAKRENFKIFWILLNFKAENLLYLANKKKSDKQKFIESLNLNSFHQNLDDKTTKQNFDAIFEALIDLKNKIFLNHLKSEISFLKKYFCCEMEFDYSPGEFLVIYYWSKLPNFGKNLKIRKFEKKEKSLKFIKIEKFCNSLKFTFDENTKILESSDLDQKMTKFVQIFNNDKTTFKNSKNPIFLLEIVKTIFNANGNALLLTILKFLRDLKKSFKNIRTFENINNFLWEKAFLIPENDYKNKVIDNKFESTEHLIRKLNILEVETEILEIGIKKFVDCTEKMSLFVIANKNVWLNFTVNYRNGELIVKTNCVSDINKLNIYNKMLSEDYRNIFKIILSIKTDFYFSKFRFSLNQFIVRKSKIGECAKKCCKNEIFYRFSKLERNKMEIILNQNLKFCVHWFDEQIYKIDLIISNKSQFDVTLDWTAKFYKMSQSLKIDDFDKIWSKFGPNLFLDWKKVIFENIIISEFAKFGINYKSDKTSKTTKFSNFCSSNKFFDLLKLDKIDVDDKISFFFKIGSNSILDKIGKNWILSDESHLQKIEYIGPIKSTILEKWIKMKLKFIQISKFVKNVKIITKENVFKWEICFSKFNKIELKSEDVLINVVFTMKGLKFSENNFSAKVRINAKICQNYSKFKEKLIKKMENFFDFKSIENYENVKTFFSVVEILPKLDGLDKFLFWSKKLDFKNGIEKSLKYQFDHFCCFTISFRNQKNKLRIKITNKNLMIESADFKQNFVKINQIDDFLRKWHFRCGFDFLKKIYFDSKYLENKKTILGQNIHHNGALLALKKYFVIKVTPENCSLQQKELLVLSSYLEKIVCAPPFSENCLKFFIKLIHSPFHVLSSLLPVISFELTSLENNEILKCSIKPEKGENFEEKNMKLFLQIFLKLSDNYTRIPLFFDMLNGQICFWALNRIDIGNKEKVNFQK
ncbi:hypothetical protein MHBO_000634 [Bonamia ostreae]|uniref:Mediator complex subunit 14 n=1 Tax=Bonamia ostreae TaxID=126728 RepID=A0ABV2AGV3_9EUKA